MADVQLENGYTQVAHEVLEALARTPIPGRHLRILLCVLRRTWGYHKSSDTLSIRQISTSTHVDERSVRRILDDLREWSILNSEPGAPGRARRLGVQKDYSLWSVDPGRRDPGRRDPGRGAPDGRRAPGVEIPHQKILNKDITPPETSSVDWMSNFLGKLPGDREEKINWLRSGIGEEIDASADVDLEDPTDRQRAGHVRRVVIARWRTYLKGARPHRMDGVRSREAEAIKKFESQFAGGEKKHAAAYR